MTQSYLDLGEMKSLIQKGKEPLPYKHPFKLLMNEIVAMIREGARHRDVAEWANNKVGLKDELRRTNKDLANDIAYWKKTNRIDEKKVEFLINQIKAYQEKEPVFKREETKTELIKDTKPISFQSTNPFV